MTPEDKVKNLLGRARSDATPTEEEWAAFLSRAHRSLAIRRGLVAGGVLALLAVGVATGAVLSRGPVRTPQPAPPAGSPREVIESATPSPSETAAEDATTDSIVLEVWFRDHQEPVFLVPAYREVPRTPAIARAAIEALLAGPSVAELEAQDGKKRPPVGTSIPAETQLLGLTIENRVATVDFSAEFNDTGLGSTYEHLPLAQVVFTLTQFDTVNAVIFEIEGKRVELYGGHGLMIDGPLKRKDYEDSAPPIIVDGPHPQDEIDETFVLEGTANVFEATVSYRILDEDGRVLEEGFTTATCGSGCRGDYSKKISVNVTEKTQAVIEVFESSAEDGSPLHMVRVPVTILP
jgi:spore germination protein GerM